MIRPQTDEHHDYRGYAGQVAGGVLRPGDEVVVLPCGRAHARSRAIDTFDGELAEAVPADVGDACASRTTSTSRAAT